MIGVGLGIEEIARQLGDETAYPSVTWKEFLELVVLAGMYKMIDIKYRELMQDKRLSSVFERTQNSMNKKMAEDILGLKVGYTTADVKKAYRRMVMRYHPDRGGTVESFIRVKSAYDFLIDGKVMIFNPSAGKQKAEVKEVGNKSVEQKLNDISKIEIPGFKNGVYEGKDYIALQGVVITPEKIVDTFKHVLLTISKILENELERVVLSSGSIFVNKFGYPKLPGDLDIAMTYKGFKRVMKLFENYKDLINLRYSRIDNPSEEIDKNDREELDRLAKLGLLRMDFYIYKNGVAINAEVFPERPGRGLIQLDHMTQMHELIKVKFYGGTLNTLPDKRLTQSYFANMIREMIVDSIYRPNKKKKASIRLNNITEYLNYVEVKNLNDIISECLKWFFTKPIKYY